ncbi:MAG TPA: hypothetical protein VMA53_01185 [Stellaceae bacterium]|nr:hypothetical protein [Stellaceae bacterium]
MMTPRALNAAITAVIDLLIDDLELSAADTGHVLSLALARAMRSAVASKRMTENAVLLLLESIRTIALDAPTSGIADNDN